MVDVSSDSQCPSHKHNLSLPLGEGRFINKDGSKICHGPCCNDCYVFPLFHKGSEESFCRNGLGFSWALLEFYISATTTTVDFPSRLMGSIGRRGKKRSVSSYIYRYIFSMEKTKKRQGVVRAFLYCYVSVCASHSKKVYAFIFCSYGKGYGIVDTCIKIKN